MKFIHTYFKNEKIRENKEMHVGKENGSRFIKIWILLTKILLRTKFLENRNYFDKKNFEIQI